MSRPTVERPGAVGIARPAPLIDRWTPLTLARRRSLAVAVSEAEAALDRGDDPAVVHAWRTLVEALRYGAVVGARPPSGGANGT